MSTLKTVGRRVLRVPLVRKTALALAAARGYSLVLVYHRLTLDRHAREALIPSVSVDLFRRQMETLLESGAVLRLEELLRPAEAWSRPRFAVTFDDDLPSHCECVVPVLRDLGITATFFLSGRALAGLGPLWFETLDRLIATRGVAHSARTLGVATSNIEQLAVACEADPLLQQRISALDRGEAEHLDAAQLRAIADAGMSIGFHTLEHPRLTDLAEADLDSAVSRGRTELEQCVQQRITLFAYPHGKPDYRVVTHLRAHGFEAACTGRPVPFHLRADPYRIGRWEPGRVSVDEFAAGLAARINGLRRPG